MREHGAVPVERARYHLPALAGTDSRPATAATPQAVTDMHRNKLDHNWSAITCGAG